MPTQQQIADHLDLDQSAVSRLVDKLGIDYRQTSIDDIRVEYIRHLRGIAAGRVGDGGYDLATERAMTERVEREIKILTLAEKKGQLVNAEQLERAYGQMVGAFQSDLLSLPDKIAQEMRTLYGVDVDVELLNEHVNGCLEQLAGYDPDRARSDPAAGEAADAGREDRDDGLGEALSPSEREGSSEPG
ncbi:MarR family transcriptional regulator [Paraburkholderia terricola]|uniref:Phage DNA packaging protein, Nu1 subunit of terminase n=1 Tax=Paraburkholderia terricola TaxID=169427 RepID=A0A1M6YQY2_9BURK|nr:MULTISPECIES: MarR family transcriptional regulator [Paraburkholderia]SDO12377.1 hypothetical protein SAMN05192547_1009206 [Paraburkholderia sediminicola]SHL20550.1 hypothetical protein SAMN05192548_107520 [Paraburkholderia terricola]